MNTLIVPLILCIVRANAMDKQEVKEKATSPTLNAIQQNPKYEMIYQPIKFQQPLQQVQQLHLQPQFPQFQPKPQYIPIQFIPKQYLIPQPQPQAMIIIAQPALLPQSLVYSNPTQQLLNYFHSNPQARNQLLHGNPQQIQQPQPTATFMQPILATPTIANYAVTTPQVPPQPQLVPQPVQQPQRTQQPPQLNSLVNLAQLAAQQYLASQMKTAPAIVTGFEHFTPEQQTQIKAQLSTHLGTNFHAVPSKYVEQENNNFVPSQQIQTDPVTTVGPLQTADILKTRFMKGKN